MPIRSRYDGIADWYDELFKDNASEQGTAGRLGDGVGPGMGQALLDVACGTGHHFAALQRRNWRVVGVDLSSDQLRLARTRSAWILRADGCQLPLRKGAFEVVVATFVHTDVDDFAGVLREVSRVLVPGGRFVYLGLHPCFMGPFVIRDGETASGRLTFTAGYGDSRRVHAGSGGPTGSGLNRAVGAKWLSLTEFLDAFFQAGLRITQLAEFDGVVVPRNVGIEALAEAADAHRAAA